MTSLSIFNEEFAAMVYDSSATSQHSSTTYN